MAGRADVFYRNGRATGGRPSRLSDLAAPDILTLGPDRNLALFQPRRCGLPRPVREKCEYEIRVLFRATLDRERRLVVGDERGTAGTRFEAARRRFRFNSWRRYRVHIFVMRLTRPARFANRYSFSTMTIAGPMMGSRGARSILSSCGDPRTRFVFNRCFISPGNNPRRRALSTRRRTSSV